MQKSLFELGNIAGQFLSDKLKVVEKREELILKISKAVEDYLSKEQDGSVILNADHDYGDMVYPKIRMPMLEIIEQLNLSKDDFQNIEIDGKEYSVECVDVFINKFTVSVTTFGELKDQDGAMYSLTTIRFLYLSKYHCSELIKGLEEQIEQPEKNLAIGFQKESSNAEKELLKHLKDIYPSLDDFVD